MRTPIPGIPGIGVRGAAAPDCAAIGSFLAGLSLHTRYLRFFTPLSQPSPAVLCRMCGAGQGVDALVATADGAVVGHAMAADGARAEGFLVSDIAVVVADRWQNRGIGSHLLAALAQRAAARGVRVLVMDVLQENRRMLGMISRRWPDAGYEADGGCVTVRACLPPPRAPDRRAQPVAAA